MIHADNGSVGREFNAARALQPRFSQRPQYWPHAGESRIMTLFRKIYFGLAVLSLLFLLECLLPIQLV